ncbi:hypothetical protein [Bordetella sp. FB-8]|uniref:hypothetical protein n=1 Tax=Bordetella sp. FB-8 TaxID=1159870 RepID=UPI0018CB9BEB|nr:hypothetical protein [Bordetella sp. FB-8]
MLPLVVLPNTCSLQQFAISKLEKGRVPYQIAHSASGVSGLHLALSAGLGVSCLNACALPEGVVPFTGTPALPALPEVEFSFVPPRPGELPLVSQVREMLVAQFR